VIGNRPSVLQMTLLAACLSVAANALADRAFPGQAPDRHLILIQEKVDSLFEAGRYERAMFIYRHELAPLGDKYAQYMVGYMYLAGKSVDKDPVTALAWFRLAAERGEETFVSASDKLTAVLSTEQRARADAIYMTLRAELGDMILMMRLVESDLQRLASRNTLNTSFNGTAARNGLDRDILDRQIAARVSARMRYLDQYLAAAADASESELQQLAALDARVARELGGLELRR